MGSRGPAHGTFSASNSVVIVANPMRPAGTVAAVASPLKRTQNATALITASGDASMAASSTLAPSRGAAPSVTTTGAAHADAAAPLRTLNVLAATWNCGNARPPRDLSPWLPRHGRMPPTASALVPGCSDAAPVAHYDIIIVGLQECTFKGKQQGRGSVRASGGAGSDVGAGTPHSDLGQNGTTPVSSASMGVMSPSVASPPAAAASTLPHAVSHAASTGLDGIATTLVEDEFDDEDEAVGAPGDAENQPSARADNDDDDADDSEEEFERLVSSPASTALSATTAGSGGTSAVARAMKTTADGTRAAAAATVKGGKMVADAAVAGTRIVAGAAAATGAIVADTLVAVADGQALQQLQNWAKTKPAVYNTCRFFTAVKVRLVFHAVWLSAMQCRARCTSVNLYLKRGLADHHSPLSDVVVVCACRIIWGLGTCK